MPKLTKHQSKRAFSVTAKLSADEYEAVSEAAERLKMRPSEFAREILLASTHIQSGDRLLLLKACKIEAMLQLLFGGLFAQMNDRVVFEKEHFKQALDTAETVQVRKAEEHILRYGPAAKTGNRKPA